MNFSRTTIRKTLGLTAPILITFAVPAAQASPLMFVTNVSTPANVLAMASTTSQCISLTYDRNGNRLSQTVSLMIGTTTYWNSGVYGCFVWNP